MREIIRYQTIINGCSVNDIANSESHDSDAGTFNYYLFLRPGGSGAIMREKTDELEYRFSVFGTFSESIWTNRSSHVYKRTSEFKAL